STPPPVTAQHSTEQWNGGDALEAFGLVQLGARIYDPVIGRFLSRDPLLIPRTAATTNPYAFAMNDPINGSDPSGLDDETAPPGRNDDDDDQQPISFGPMMPGAGGLSNPNLLAWQRLGKPDGEYRNSHEPWEYKKIRFRDDNIEREAEECSLLGC